MDKRFILTVVALLVATPALAGEPVAFKDYKKLALEERQILIQQASAELRKQYKRWDQLISMGGQDWNRRTACAIGNAKGFDGFSVLMGVHGNIWGTYLFQHSSYERPDLPKDRQIAIVDPALLPESSALDKESYKDDWYFVHVAPTPEAMELNKRAADLGAKWQRFINDPPKAITRKDIDALDADVKQIRDEMRKLPLWTPEDVEEAFAALPDQERHTR